PITTTSPLLIRHSSCADVRLPALILTRVAAPRGDEGRLPVARCDVERGRACSFRQSGRPPAEGPAPVRGEGRKRHEGDRHEVGSEAVHPPGGDDEPEQTG